MQLDEQWRGALDGTTFSAAELFQIRTAPGDPLTRFEAAERLAAGRRVLHVGCVDHLPLIDEKMRAGTWMHGVLTSSAASCGGIDLNREGIEELRRRGFDNLWVGDPSASPDPDVLAADWDMLFLGEILEHVDSPVDYLGKIKATWLGRCRSVVITVPNALGWGTIRAAVRSGGELINTDHRYWFTPFTLAKVVSRAGLEIERLYLCEAFGFNASASLISRGKQRALSAMLRRRPILRSVIVAELTI